VGHFYDEVKENQKPRYIFSLNFCLEITVISENVMIAK